MCNTNAWLCKWVQSSISRVIDSVFIVCGALKEKGEFNRLIIIIFSTIEFSSAVCARFTPEPRVNGPEVDLRGIKNTL